MREAPDLTRVSVGRGDDGRLRAALTLGEEIRPRDLVARSGPPGSLCLRLWTASTPPNTRPDYLVCVTAEANGRTLRGTVLRERSDAALPHRVAAASVTRKGGRSVIVRFSQSSIGRPAVLRFAAEATRPGCVRTSCVDTAPDAPAAARLRLHEIQARTGLSKSGA